MYIYVYIILHQPIYTIVVECLHIVPLLILWSVYWLYKYLPVLALFA